MDVSRFTTIITDRDVFLKKSVTFCCRKSPPPGLVVGDDCGSLFLTMTTELSTLNENEDNLTARYTLNKSECTAHLSLWTLIP